MKLVGRTGRLRVRRGQLRAIATPASVPPPSSKPAKERNLTTPDSARGALPDLLHDQPAISLDEPAILHALSFAFAAGSAGGTLNSALQRTAVASSSFTPHTLQDGLFLDELIAHAFDFPLRGKPAPIDRAQLRKLLSRPPNQRADIELRQAVLRELASSAEHKANLEQVYAAIADLPRMLDDESTDVRLDESGWRLDVLRALHAAFTELDERFEREGSALQRLAAFGAHVRQSEGFEQLAALLDFESDRARADLQVQLGADGRIRSLAIVSLRERQKAPFYVHPLLRYVRRLWAFVQGYSLGENELVDRWFESVFQGVLAFIPSLLQLKGDLEFYLGALHFKQLAEARGLGVCLPRLVAGEQLREPKRVRDLWNPLLLAQPRAPVPTQLALPSFSYTCITTGPNSGGKTRFLQAVALCQLLGQAGMFVPAREAAIRLAAGMFVSLGEAPHVDQKEGRLGMELTRIRNLFEHARGGSVVILDELCSGTNPSEGEEIFRMLLELLHELEHEVHITTHFLSFAASLQSEAASLGLSFLQVELDAEDQPSYRFVPGVATTSLAQQTALRLGVTREQLRELIHQRAARD